jgi:regulator of sigma E protease
MTVISTAVTAIIFFSVIIMIHELGHFLVAKSVGIYAEEFSLGMGPRLFMFKGKETVYSLRALPIGGYVKFLGEDDTSTDPRAFNNANVWKRMAVIFAGPAMNFVLAILLFSIYFAAFGVYDVETPIIGNIIEGYPAQEAGLLPGDRILSIDETDFTKRDDKDAVTGIQTKINESQGSPLKITVLRDKKKLKFTIVPRYDEETGRYLLGFNFGQLRRISLTSALSLSVVQTGRLIVAMIDILGNLIFKGEGINTLTGPVGIVSEIGKAAQAGLKQLLSLGILITINLGIFNLIPFPALDGGRLTLLLVEGLRRKPIDPKKEGYIHLIGFVLLMLLMVLVTFQDIFRR